MSDRKKYIYLPAVLNYPEMKLPMNTPVPTKRVDLPREGRMVTIYSLPDKNKKNPTIEGDQEIYEYKFKRLKTSYVRKPPTDSELSK